ncbi:MAG: LLM class flavin-dependent oxidoreductase [Dehalococcoidia bacterium]
MTAMTALPVRVGMFLPRGEIDADKREVARVLDRMRLAGIDYVGVAHVSFHTGWGQDGLTEAMALAALSDLPVYIGVYLLALRHPVVTARQIAQFNQRAPGKLILGVGVGGEDRHEVEICGIDPKTRGRRTDECIEILRLLLSGEWSDYQGRFYEFEHTRIIPGTPVELPIIVGGRDPRALRRAGVLGDGWLGIWSTPEKYAERRAEVEAYAAEAGRTDVAWDHSLQPWCGIATTKAAARERVATGMENLYRIPFKRFERFTPYGTPAEVAAFFRPYVAAGACHFNMSAQTETWEEAVEGVAEVRRLLKREADRSQHRDR